MPSEAEDEMILSDSMKSIEETIRIIRDKVRSTNRPVVVGIDGGTGAGKTTIAKQIHEETNSALVHLDDFYTTEIPEHAWPRYESRERLEHIFDWKRVREHALMPLLNRQPGRWQAFDFTAGLLSNGTYGLQTEYTEVQPAEVILLEGMGACAPPLSDLIDVKILVYAADQVRYERLRRRKDPDFLREWRRLWDEYVRFYLDEICPADSFDIIIDNRRSNIGLDRIHFEV